jgi:predicted CoA-binding protein
MSEPRCEIPQHNPGPDAIATLLRQARRIAVVGHSDNPSRDSYRVAHYLRKHGYEVFPVNPLAKSGAGITFYPDLASVPKPIDIVDIFRRPEFLGAVVDEAIREGAKAVWMQERLVDNAAAARAQTAGLAVVMDRCILKEHARLIG